ncbi:hypothetical protein [Spirosoma utsteinense]|uniref:Uncharacterized protein n=1 Tax=Spirosoma utsteinense TaxID=2585773 RepID=A0ABR6VZX8_9BACT|nr:hypothetical protein [Spirosoma utsteinense]MBC3786905.1 hypothetical protein [Spirosoma utsteinense]MBC3789798.1 hypothetical protein [Spirosoma utsteinense]
MTTQQTQTNPVDDELPIDNADVIGSRMGRMDPAIFSNQDTPIDGGSAADDEDSDSHKAEAEEDEPTTPYPTTHE